MFNRSGMKNLQFVWNKLLKKLQRKSIQHTQGKWFVKRDPGQINCRSWKTKYLPVTYRKATFTKTPFPILTDIANQLPTANHQLYCYNLTTTTRLLTWALNCRVTQRRLLTCLLCCPGTVVAVRCRYYKDVRSWRLSTVNWPPSPPDKTTLSVGDSFSVYVLVHVCVQDTIKKSHCARPDLVPTANQGLMRGTHHAGLRVFASTRGWRRPYVHQHCQYIWRSTNNPIERCCILTQTGKQIWRMQYTIICRVHHWKKQLTESHK